ncbi:MAG: hypothetical protein KDD25_02570 [Bdellovibrionales bacterium]|nr:hypothetical protein [Bdellovibrionales bacterium]
MRLLQLVLLAAACTSCISLSVGGSKTKKSDKVKYLAPNKDFTSTTVESADAAWINKKRGTTISYQSACEESTEPSLDTIVGNAITDINEKEVLESTNFIFNDRKAFRSKVSGTVDGIPVHLDLVAFKKNGCSYLLTYVSLREHFNKDLNQFEKFVRSFKAE